MVQCEVKTELASGLEVTSEVAAYDLSCKRLLAVKKVLARIMRRCLPEFRCFDVDTIAERCIEGTPRLEQVPVYPDETGAFLRGLGQERASPTEGSVLFDICFDAVVPDSDEVVQLIINVEAQADFYPGYPLVKRGIYYCARLLSAQKETVFRKSHYERLRKVYSVWVCTDVPKYYRNTITAYSMAEENLVGDIRADKADYDLLSVVMIGLGDPDDGSCDGLIRFLSILLSAKMSAEVKKRILRDEFECSMMDVDERILDMGSLGWALVKKSMQEGLEQGLEQGLERGRSEGRAEGRSEGLLDSIRNLMESMGWGITEAMNALRIPEDERQVYINKLSQSGM